MPILKASESMRVFRNHSLSTCVKYFAKLTFLPPNTHTYVCAY